LTKKEKTIFFFVCGKQVKVNPLIFLVFYCVSSILSATGPQSQETFARLLPVLAACQESAAILASL
jgi:hypothetical protein